MVSGDMKSVLKNEIKEEDIGYYFKGSSFPKFGKILYNGEETHFLKIYHTSRANPLRCRNKSPDYRKLVNDKILPLIKIE
jgi:hypothetical protein